MTKVTSKWHEIWWGALYHGVKGLHKVTRPSEYVEELNQDLGVNDQKTLLEYELRFKIPNYLTRHLIRNQRFYEHKVIDLWKFYACK